MIHIPLSVEKVRRPSPSGWAFMLFEVARPFCQEKLSCQNCQFARHAQESQRGTRFAGTRREGPKRSSDGLGQGKRPRTGGPWRDVPHGEGVGCSLAAASASGGPQRGDHAPSLDRLGRQNVTEARHKRDRGATHPRQLAREEIQHTSSHFESSSLTPFIAVLDDKSITALAFPSHSRPPRKTFS